MGGAGGDSDSNGTPRMGEAWLGGTRIGGVNPAHGLYIKHWSWRHGQCTARNYATQPPSTPVAPCATPLHHALRSHADHEILRAPTAAVAVSLPRLAALSTACCLRRRCILCMIAARRSRPATAQSGPGPRARGRHRCVCVRMHRSLVISPGLLSMPACVAHLALTFLAEPSPRRFLPSALLATAQIDAAMSATAAAPMPAPTAQQPEAPKRDSSADSTASGATSPPPTNTAAAIPAEQRVRKLSAAAPAWTPETHARTPSGGFAVDPSGLSVPSSVRRLSTSSASSATSPPPVVDERESDDAEDEEELASLIAQALTANAASTDRPCPLLLTAVQRQVEYLFSNQSLWKHAELATEMARDPLGLGNVDLHVVLALREVQALTHDMQTLVQALRASEKLVVSPDAAQVRRLTPLPAYDSCRDSNRTIFVDRLPPGSTVSSIKKMFAKFGRVVYVLRSDQLLGASGNNPAAKGALTPFQSPKMKPQRSMSASEGSPGQIVRRLMQTNAVSGTPSKPAAADSASVQHSPKLEGMSGVGVGSLVHLSPAARNRAIAAHASTMHADPDSFTACFIHFDRPATAKKAVSHIVAFNKQLKASTPKGSPRVSARKNSLGSHGGVPLAPLGPAMGGPHDSTPPRGGRSIRIMSAAQPTPTNLSPKDPQHSHVLASPPIVVRPSLRSPLGGPQKTPGNSISPPPAAISPGTEQKTAATAVPAATAATTIADPSAPESAATPTNAAAASTAPAAGSADASSPTGASGVAHEGLLSPSSAGAVVPVAPLPDSFVGLFVMPKLAYLKSVALKNATQKKDSQGSMLSPALGSLSAATAAAAASSAAATPNSAHATHSTSLLHSMPLLSLLGAPVFSPASATAAQHAAVAPAGAPHSASKRSNQASPQPSKHAVAHASPLFMHQQPMIHIPIPASAQAHQQHQKEAAAAHAAAAAASGPAPHHPAPTAIAHHPVSVLSARAPEFNPSAPSPLLKSAAAATGAGSGGMQSFALGAGAAAPSAPAGIGSPQLHGRAQRDNWRSEGLPPSASAGESDELSSFHLQSSSSSPSFGPAATPQFDEHGNPIPGKKQKQQQSKKGRSAASPSLDGLNPEETGAAHAPRPAKLEGDRPKFSLTKRPSSTAVGPNGVLGASAGAGGASGGNGGASGGPQVLTRFAVGPDSAEAVGFASRGRGGALAQQPQLPPAHRGSPQTVMMGAGGGKPL